MNSAFEVAAGTVVGREHAVAGRNNQDALCWLGTPEMTVAVVADGCGSGRHSEVGAKVGARLVVEALRRHVPRLGTWPAESVLEYVRLDVLERLRSLAGGMGGGLSQAVSDYLLFTVVGAVVTETVAFVFTLGDGVTVVNGQPEILAFPGNEPPYLSYGLTGSSVTDSRPDALRFGLRRSLRTIDLSSVLIGSDGAADLLRIADRSLPGGRDPVGPIRQFWEDDRYFRNPASLTRRLTLMNRESTRVEWQRRTLARDRGLLPDDTTLVVIRRRPER